MKIHVIVYGRVPWLYKYWPGGFMLFVVLCPGTPEGSTGSGSGLNPIFSIFIMFSLIPSDTNDPQGLMRR